MIRAARNHPRISVGPEVMGGKPCIKGTRIPVDLTLRYLGDRASMRSWARFPASPPTTFARRRRSRPMS